MYSPKFSTTNRGGKKALWVSMPSNEKYNIWDIRECIMTDEVKQAVIHAFELGYQARGMLDAPVNLPRTFEEE